MARLACWVLAPFEMFKELKTGEPFPVPGSLLEVIDKAQSRMDWRKESKDMPITLIHVLVGKRKTELESSLGLFIITVR